MESRATQLNFFAAMLHTHLAGVAVRVRQFRDGKELAVIAKDDAYNFNFQETRILQKEYVVKPVTVHFLKILLYIKNGKIYVLCMYSLCVLCPVTTLPKPNLSLMLPPFTGTVEA